MLWLELWLSPESSGVKCLAALLVGGGTLKKCMSLKTLWQDHTIFSSAPRPKVNRLHYHPQSLSCLVLPWAQSSGTRAEISVRRVSRACSVWYARNIDERFCAFHHVRMNNSESVGFRGLYDSSLSYNPTYLTNLPEVSAETFILIVIANVNSYHTEHGKYVYKPICTL